MAKEVIPAFGISMAYRTMVTQNFLTDVQS